MDCKDCGKPLERPKQQFCEECKRKRDIACIKKCNQNRYKNDPEFRKDMLKRTLEWQANHPERHWAITTIKNHKITGKVEIYFSLDQLEEMALKTKICPYCGVLLIYGKKGRKGFDTHSPSMDNINNVPALLIKDVQIICAQCNSAKLKMNRDEFKEYVKRLHNCIFQDNEWQSKIHMFRNEIIEFGKLRGIKEEDITSSYWYFYNGAENPLLKALSMLWFYGTPDELAKKNFEEVKKVFLI